MRIKLEPDVAFITLFLMLLVCIIIPMPGWLLDFFISINICATILILVISLNISSAVELPSFPSILLITTLFRLSLNVASTRAILTEGDAGRIISAFGNFVISGNYFAGAVVFVIITIIQLIVVTKGAERVAEVSARFTLDAMPGKQMSIDAELRSGHINLDEAIKRRSLLAIESQFFGSMDGAMKFVKGDAIAGILISIINIIGGILTGTITKDLNLQEAISKYIILSIGDGLVSQIPSLIISVSAGIIITRISTIKKAGLGKEIFISLTRKPLMILIAGVIAFLFSLLPHIPFLPFFIVGVLLSLAYKKLNLPRTEEKLTTESEKTGKETESVNRGVSEMPSPFAEPITLTVSEGLCSDKSIGSPAHIINVILPSLRKRLLENLGFRMPGVRIELSESTTPSFSLGIYGVETIKLKFENNPSFKIDGSYSEDIITEIANGKYIKYLQNTDKEKMDSELYNLNFVLSEILYAQIQRNVRELFGIQETSELIDEFSHRYPALIRETIPRTIGINILTEILKNLLSEGIPIKNMKGILESIEQYAHFEKSPFLLTEFVRVSLGRQICHSYSVNNCLPTYILSQNITKVLLDSISYIGNEQVLSISPENARKIIEAVKKIRKNCEGPFIIMTEFETRRFLRKIIEFELPFVPVISFKEISPDVKIEPLGLVEFTS
ncbi:MAG: flagellar biosynthesis protein FlhA [Deltaproteobacteria bacterium]|nr:flagellar biosynthesis protein FlhA [Deltaproteobacteria bacterium]